MTKFDVRLEDGETRTAPAEDLDLSRGFPEPEFSSLVQATLSRAGTCRLMVLPREYTTCLKLRSLPNELCFSSPPR